MRQALFLIYIWLYIVYLSTQRQCISSKNAETCLHSDSVGPFFTVTLSLYRQDWPFTVRYIDSQIKIMYLSTGRKIYTHLLF